MCVRASMASAGRAFNLSGQPDGEQRPAVSYSGARARGPGSSVGGVQGRQSCASVETRTLAFLCHRIANTIDKQLVLYARVLQLY